MARRNRWFGPVLVVLAVVIGACGSSQNDPAATNRHLLVSEVRDAESFVVGLVFTQLMTDDDIVAATLALCDVKSRLGYDTAIEEATGILRALDWRAPANGSMLGRMLRAGGTSVCGEAGTEAETALAQLLPARPQFSIGGATAADVDAAVAAFLDTSEGDLFITTIRQQEAQHPEVFTAAMSDDELVDLGRGICSTIGELGPDADEELRRHQASYGWTGEADSAMFALIVDSSEAVCITVGS
ncbi:MAG: hypothetical protein A2135_02960 [Actinobacteria bacterium RBG_16_67_15]|nr:MAG: hypothetical protein A2135_02960 [Actinobacteria bacterium RBG_16_67_15]